MRAAEKIIAPGHSLDGARVRCLVNGRCAILLDVHPGYRRFERIVVPTGMLSGDRAISAGQVTILCRSQEGKSAMVEFRHVNNRTCLAVMIQGVTTQSGLLQVNSFQNGAVITPDDPFDPSRHLDCTDPLTGETFTIRPSDLQRGSALVLADLVATQARALIVAPYSDVDGMRVYVTPTTEFMLWPCDVNRLDRCLLDPHAETCICGAAGRVVSVIDDFALIPEWWIATNAQIIRAGTTFNAGPKQLSSDYTGPQVICPVCPRSSCRAHVQNSDGENISCTLAEQALL